MSGFQHKYAFTNGIRMHYIDEGEGPVVVLLHGWPESWYSWRHQISFLADAGYRVIAPDQRGYGDTEVPSEVGSYHILNLVGDVVGLLNALEIRSAALVGHDWGSMVAAAAALLRPDLFHRVCLLSVPYMPRRSLRPSTRFQLATQGKHFYQDYFQRVGVVEKELGEDTHRSILGALYAGSGEARMHPEHSRSGFISFDKSTRFVDNLVVPDQLPAWLTEEDLDVFVKQFERSGFFGGINWYRNMDRNWELTPFWNGAVLIQPLLFIAGELDGVLTMAGDGVVAIPAWSEPLVVAVPERHPILSHKHIPLEELLRYPLVLCDPQACEGHARQVERFLRQAEAEPLVAEQVTSCDLMMALVAAGFALGLTGESCIAASRESGVVGRALRGFPQLTTYLLRSPREPSATLTRFIERVQTIDSSDDVQIASQVNTREEI